MAVKLGRVALLTLFVVCSALLFGQQPQAQKLELSLGKSQLAPNTDITVSFEELVDDSRCPIGTTCIWAGDAAVKIRLSSPTGPASTHTLHTNAQFEQKAERDGMVVLLTAVTPRPVADSENRREDYRVALSISRK